MSRAHLVAVACFALGALTAAASNAAPPPYRGTLTLSRDGAGDPFNPAVVVDLDLASNKTVVRFDGFDPHRTRAGETAYLTRLAPGHIVDVGVVAADARGVPGPPLHVCRTFSFASNRICHAPKLSPDAQRIAFGTAAGGGKVCKDSYGTKWADYVVVRDRKGGEVARFEGWYHPEWLPDGRLLMLGSPCRGAGVWIADASPREPKRVDGNQIATPARHPAVSPDGKRVALVWNNQVWTLALDDPRQLVQVTRMDKPVASAAWSPDGSALAVLQWNATNVTMPAKALVLLRPGDERSTVVRELEFYPFGPMSWR